MAIAIVSDCACAQENPRQLWFDLVSIFSLNSFDGISLWAVCNQDTVSLLRQVEDPECSWHVLFWSLLLWFFCSILCLYLLYVYLYIHIYVYTYICIYIYIYICIYIYVYIICIHIYVYIYMYIHSDYCIYIYISLISLYLTIIQHIFFVALLSFSLQFPSRRAGLVPLDRTPGSSHVTHVEARKCCEQLVAQPAESIWSEFLY